MAGRIKLQTARDRVDGVDARALPRFDVRGAALPRNHHHRYGSSCQYLFLCSSQLQVHANTYMCSAATLGRNCERTLPCDDTVSGSTYTAIMRSTPI